MFLSFSNEVNLVGSSRFVPGGHFLQKRDRSFSFCDVSEEHEFDPEPQTQKVWQSQMFPLVLWLNSGSRSRTLWIWFCFLKYIQSRFGVECVVVDVGQNKSLTRQEPSERVRDDSEEQPWSSGTNRLLQLWSRVHPQKHPSVPGQTLRRNPHPPVWSGRSWRRCRVWVWPGADVSAAVDLNSDLNRSWRRQLDQKSGYLCKSVHLSEVLVGFTGFKFLAETLIIIRTWWSLEHLSSHTLGSFKGNKCFNVFFLSALPA